MVDVVFLLLIFFMISTSFVDSSAININLPEAPTGAAEGEQADVVKVSMDENGHIYFNEREVNMAELTLQLNNYSGNPAQTNFKLLADKEVKHGSVISIVDLARQNGFTRLFIATQDTAPAKGQNNP